MSGRGTIRTRPHLTELREPAVVDLVHICRIRRKYEMGAAEVGCGLLGSDKIKEKKKIGTLFSFGHFLLISRWGRCLPATLK
jgi:hypothetical protein